MKKLFSAAFILTIVLCGLGFADNVYFGSNLLPAIVGVTALIMAAAVVVMLYITLVYFEKRME